MIDKLKTWVAGQDSPFTLADASECLKLRSRIGNRSVQSRIGRALAALGCERFEKKTPDARHWYAPPTLKNNIAEEEK